MSPFRAKLYALLLTLCLVLAPMAQAQAPAKQQGKPAAQSKGNATAATPQAAKDPLEGLDAFVETLRADWKVPGVGIAIVKGDQVIYAKGFGQRDVGQNLPVTPDTLFAIGSCSKAFTATAVGMLVDEGKIDWDKPLRTYLPSFKMWDDYVTEHMTPRDLVTHRSGLPRHDLLWYGSTFTRREMFERLRYLEPSRGFRASYQYQNLMFMTAGVLVEEVARKSWEDFIHERFFVPLEMKTSNTSVNDSQKAADFARPYGGDSEKSNVIPFRNIDQIGPAGSINSSVREMSNWIIAQLNGGKFKGKQVIPERVLKETHTPHIVSGTTLRYDELFYSMYAMGWGVNAYRGHLMVTHSGGIDGFTAHVSLLPKDKLGIVILTSKGGTRLTGILAFNIYDRLLGMEPAPWNDRNKEEVAKAREAEQKTEKEGDKNRKDGTQPSHALGDFAGEFDHPGYGTLKIWENAGKLHASYNGLSTPLKHYHYDVFEATEAQFSKMKFSFRLNGKGDVERVSLPLQSGVSDIVFTRRPPPADQQKAGSGQP
ncbi:MAG: serine hydrolase [Verrucomicrobiales bacterium]|nr:serine hydrolase [Verrucomicrobiales bacterium]